MNTQTLSLSEQLFSNTLNKLVNSLHLSETLDNDNPYMILESQVPVVDGNVGEVRLFTGSPIFRLVTCSLVIPQFQLDSHMLFAFTKKDSAVPHFTLDSVKSENHLAFHLDLIPRLDLAENLLYMDEVYSPLTDTFTETSEIDGLSKAQLSPHQCALMSPWMLASRANEVAFQQIEHAVHIYLQQWLTLLENGLSESAIEHSSTTQLMKRNFKNKKNLFNANVDPVWNRVMSIIGANATDKLLALLIGEDE